MRKIILFFLLNIFLIVNSNALIEIDITRGNLDPLPIAVSPLHVDVKSQNYEGVKIKELGENILKIISGQQDYLIHLRKKPLFKNQILLI